MSTNNSNTAVQTDSIINLKPTSDMNTSVGVGADASNVAVQSGRDTKSTPQTCNPNISSSDIYQIDGDYDIVIKGDNKKITGRQSLLLIPITSFFNNKNNLEKLIPILNATSPISLRIIDWFVTNYSKEHNIMFNKEKYLNKEKKSIDAKKKKEKKMKSKDGKIKFDDFIFVHNDYKSQLKSYNKKNFDPFCRRDRINLYYNKNKYFSTTIGQLNFFKWAIENYIIDYISDNITKIKNIMDAQIQQANDAKSIKKKVNLDVTVDKQEEMSKKKVKKRKKISTKKNKKNISGGGNKSMVRHHYPTVITFD